MRQDSTMAAFLILFFILVLILVYILAVPPEIRMAMLGN